MSDPGGSSTGQHLNSLPLAVDELERLRIDPEADEQRLPVDPELYNDEVLRRLNEHFDIYIERYNQPVIEDGDQEDWDQIGKSSLSTDIKTLQRVRYLTSKQPHCVRALALYLFYVLGSDFTIELAPVYEDDEDVSEEQKKRDRKITNRSRRLWERALRHNQKSWSIWEFGKRYWRDGEQFTHRSEPGQWPTKLRFLDREMIDEPVGETRETQGVVTEEDDPTEVLYYQYVDPESKELIAEIHADEVIHTKCDADANEKRGNSRFLPIIKSARLYEAFVENEVTHRQAQASIVLVRKVAGRRGPARMYDNAQTSTTQYREGFVSREKWRPGTILTTTPDVELDFAQPESNFSDASPLAKLLLQQICAATGFTYAQLTQDATGGSFGAELVHESPVLQMIKHEQAILGQDLWNVFMWVMEDAIDNGILEGVELADIDTGKYEPRLKFFDPVSRDPLKLAQFLNLLVIARIISRTQARRELNLDNDRIMRELEEESARELADMNWLHNQNPTEDNMRKSSAQNGNAGGTNQGNNERPNQHKDRLPGKS